MKKNPITVEVLINAPIESVWKHWNDPESINGWAFASDDWEATAVENNTEVGGNFKTVMSAKDKSANFEFTGTYSSVTENAQLEYDMDDGRHVSIVFAQTPDGILVTETFDPENENSEEKQRSGWQAILENFKKYVEKNK